MTRKKRNLGRPAAGPVVVRRENGLIVSEGKAKRPSPDLEPNAQVPFGAQVRGRPRRAKAAQQGRQVEKGARWLKKKKPRQPEQSSIEPLDVTPDPTTGFVPKYLRTAVRDKHGRLRNPRDWRDEVADPFG